METWSCLGFPFALVPSLDILGVKFDSRFTFEDHVRGILSRVSQRIGIFRLLKRAFVDLSVLLRCYYAFVLPILQYCSTVWGYAAESKLLLLERQVYSVTRLCIRIRLFCRWVIDVMLLRCVCCTRLIRTWIIVCSVSFHLLLSEFDIPSCGCSSSIRVLSFKV